MLFHIKIIICLCIICFLSACASTKQLTAGRGAELQTLSSSVSLTLRSADNSLAGSGYLVYRKPDKAHVVVLSPFGTTLFEVFALGEQIILLYPSEKMAFIGDFNELPEKGGLKSWRLIHWVLEDAAFQNKSLQADAVVDNGLVVQKFRPDGQKVYYSKHALINGVILAHEFDLRSSKDEQLRIILDEPQVNDVMDDLAFIPRLDGMRVYPLKALER